MRKVNLADVDNSLNSLTTTYAGEYAGQYIAPALLSGNTLAQGGLTVKPNVLHKHIIKRLDLANALVPATCDFTLSADKVTITERVLQPVELQVNLQFCKKDFSQDWEAIQLGYSAHKVIPKSFSDFVIGQVINDVAATVEHTIWKGDTAGTYASFDGLVKKIEAASNVNDVTGTTITSTNVIAELGKVVDAIPSAIYGKDDLYIFVPQNVARAYVRALGGFSTVALQNVAASENVGIAGVGANGLGGNGTMWYNGGGLSIDGVKIFVANGLADNVIVAAQKSNLYFGTGLASDLNLIKTIDMADIDGSQNFRFVMRATAGVEFGVAEDIVLYN